MRRERFTAVLLDGHKDAALEVPFDPGERWLRAARPLWPGRRGHGVRGQVNGLPFESVVVGRSKRFYVLVSDDVRAEAGLSIGDSVRVELEPTDAPESASRQ